MAEPITVNGLAFTGRVDVRDPNLGQTFSVLNNDFSTNTDITVDFGVQSQGQTFGICKSLFMDNGTNPEPVEVYVSGTDQFFTIPSYSIGYYTIDANAASRIRLVTVGGATDVCTTIFYNWSRDPVVWYSFGAFNSDKPIKAYGTMSEGENIDAADFNDPIFFGGRDPSGDFLGINVDANGNIIVSNLDITIGAVYGPDAVGDVPTHPGVLNAVLDSTGDVANVQLNADNEFKVHDESVLDKLVEVLAAIEALDVTSSPATTGTFSSVAGAAADTTILASNAARKGATITNDSTAALKLLLANSVSSATVFTVELPSNAYYEVPFGYTGVIKGIWAAATGNARVTELT